MVTKQKHQGWLTFERAIILLAVVSIGILISVFMSPSAALSKEADIVLDSLTNSDGSLSLIVGNSIREEKVVLLHDMEYDVIKQSLGIAHDFCVYFEQDGVLLEVGEVTGIGADFILINGEPC